MLRDVNGFAKRGTPWGHSQYMLSFCDTGSHPGILVVNSWSEKWIKGPKKYPDQPEGTYFITPEDANFIFRQGDAWAISSYNGFPIRSLNLRIV